VGLLEVVQEHADHEDVAQTAAVTDEEDVVVGHALIERDSIDIWSAGWLRSRNCVPFVDNISWSLDRDFFPNSEKNMTLIAGFKVHDTPILVGDLVTSVGKERKSASKKIARLSDNCVLGWSGNRIIANEIYSELYKRYKNKKVAFDNFSAFLPTLRKKPDSAMFGTSFIGWIIENGSSTCFLWRTDYPYEVYPQDGPIKVGTGSPWFIDKTSFDNLAYLDLSFSKVEYSPGLAAVGALGFLMQHEFVQHTNMNDKTFGLAYEVLFYNGRFFEYMDDVSYLAFMVDVEFSGETTNNRVNAMFPPTRVRAGDDLTEVVQLASPESTVLDLKEIFRPGLNDDEAHRIKRQRQKFIRENRHLYDRFPNVFTSNFYCVMWILRNKFNGNHISTFIQAHSDTAPPDERTMSIAHSGIDGFNIKFPSETTIDQCSKYKEKMIRLGLAYKAS
jgi:hypothetical protein